MKKLAVSSIIAFLCVSGCGQDKTVEKGRLETVQLHSVAPSSEVSFFQSEMDSFHPKSAIESARKKKLVRTGKNPNPSAMKIMDTKEAWEALNPDNVFSLNMDLISFRTAPVEIPAFPFDYEDDINALKRLYKMHALDSVFTDDMDEVEKLASLMEYTYEFMEGGRAPEPGEVPGPSAEVITKLRRDKGIGGTSREYAALFCQLALSCGFNARLTGMHGIDDNGEVLTHDVCEVYLGSQDKWGVFDTFSKATYYTRDKLVLSALELHNISIDMNYRVINPVSPNADFLDIVNLREELLERYHYIYTWRMNNILGSSPRGGTISWEDLYRYHLVWEDSYSLVSDGKFDTVEAFSSDDLDGVRFVTQEVKDFNWSLGRVQLAIERTENTSFMVYIDTLMPNFAGLKISDLNEVHKIDPFTLKVDFLYGEIYIESVNSLGLTGPVAAIIFPS